MKFRPRVIPVLLLQGSGLVKTKQFGSPRYLGDPVNVVRIFNDKGVDELVLLDIDAARHGTKTDRGLLAEIASEAFVPLSSGGGIKTLDDIAARLDLGFEKVVINTAAVETPELITQAAREFGSSTISVSIDVRRRRFGKREVAIKGGSVLTGIDPLDHAVAVAERGAGEIVLQSIDLDGTMTGFDLETVRLVAGATRVPLVALGGAGKVADLSSAIRAGAAAAAAGSMFVFQGRHNAVLISYPTDEILAQAMTGTETHSR